MNRITRNTSMLLVLALAACGGEGGSPPAEEAQEPEAGATPAGQEEAAPSMDLPEGVTMAMVTEGEEIFHGAGICFTCHLQNGQGGPLAPNLQDDEWINIDGSYDAIVQNVINGVPEPIEHAAPMLPRGGTSITDEQVRAVAAYVWTLSNGG